MKTIAIRIIATILGLGLFGVTAAWAVSNDKLTDGQFLGFPLLAAMAAFCIIGVVWEQTGRR
jgi:hypothetical protein